MSIQPLWTWQHLLLSPLYLYQAKQVKKNTLRLDEPIGERYGTTAFVDANPQQPPLKVLIIGDSAGVGVGVEHQDQAFLGQFVTGLSQDKALAQYYSHIDWQLEATTGYTSFDILRQLYVMEAYAVDIVVISMGVNDTVMNLAVTQWQDNLQAMIAILKRKFCAKHILFVSIPPLQLMPALPSPLNSFMGRMAQRLDTALQQVVKDTPSTSNQQVHYLVANFEAGGLDKTTLFAKDGFHPSALTYQHWAKNVVNFVKHTLL
nr:SGNH/GDSL hydrolase family protein [Moraxella sp. CTOTU49097]